MNNFVSLGDLGEGDECIVRDDSFIELRCRVVMQYPDGQLTGVNVIGYEHHLTDCNEAGVSFKMIPDTVQTLCAKTPVILTVNRSYSSGFNNRVKLATLEVGDEFTIEDEMLGACKCRVDCKNRGGLMKVDFTIIDHENVLADLTGDSLAIEVVPSRQQSLSGDTWVTVTVERDSYYLERLLLILSDKTRANEKRIVTGRHECLSKML